MVSVIIPTYNNSKYIIDAINSVLSQSYTNLECIIIDDGSTDNTKEILHNFIQSKKVFYYFQENEGVSAARNLGIEKSKGSQILFLDADDLLHNNALELLVNNIKDYDMIFGAWEDFGIVERKNLYLHFYNNTLSTYLKYKPVPSAALIKKNKLQKWDVNLKVWEVTDYFLSIILNGSTITFTNDIVTKMRQHDGLNRASIVQDHFNPIQTLSFLAKWKKNIKDMNMLNSEVEAVIDVEIINNIYIAIRNKSNHRSLKTFFAIINVKNLKNALSYKKFGLYFFIVHLKTFSAILFFKKLNGFLGRI